MNLFTWLDHLSVLYPPSHIALVGAGSGRCRLVQWLLQQPAKAPTTLFEADPAQYQLLQRSLELQQTPAQVQAQQQLVSPQESEQAFYRTNIASESGLLAPELQHAIQPQLAATQQLSLQGASLSQLLPQQPASPARHWLLVECLPACTILQSASQHLPHTAVIVARATAETAAGLKDQGASLQELRDLLQPQGFALLAQEEERNPAYVQAVFVRDYAQLQQAQDAEAKAKADLQTQYNNLQAEQAETRQRQTMIDEELHRAEVQLKLLEELLLGEQQDAPAEQPTPPAAASAHPKP